MSVVFLEHIDKIAGCVSVQQIWGLDYYLHGAESGHSTQLNLELAQLQKFFFQKGVARSICSAYFSSEKILTVIVVLKHTYYAHGLGRNIELHTLVSPKQTGRLPYGRFPQAVCSNPPPGQQGIFIFYKKITLEYNYIGISGGLQQNVANSFIVCIFLPLHLITLSFSFLPQPHHSPCFPLPAPRQQQW